MKNYLLSAILLTALMSCEKKIDEKVSTSTTPPDSVVVPETNEPTESSTKQTCYMGAMGKDSVFVSVEDNLGTLTGKLRYKNFEKDSSSGDLVGSQNGDTLKVYYTFQAEGMTSRREIFFLKKNGNLLEGIGDQKVEGNQSMYSDPTKITFGNGWVLKAADCSVVDKKISSK